MSTNNSPPQQPSSTLPESTTEKETPTSSTGSGVTNNSTTLALLDPNKIVPIQITLPTQIGVPNSEQRVLTIQVPASALQENQLQHVLTGPIISSILPLPQQIASTVLQQHVNAALHQNQIAASKLFFDNFLSHRNK